MRYLGPGMIGFSEINPGRAGRALLWYGQGTLSQLQDDLSDLAGLGGCPYDEDEREDGLEAPLRPAWRSSSDEWQPELQTALSPELMKAWSDDGLLTDADRQLDAVRQRERARAEADEAERLRRYARIKREHARARLERFGAERARVQRAALLPPARKRRSFVSIEQLNAFLAED